MKFAEINAIICYLYYKKSGRNNHETDETDEISPFTMQEMILNRVNAISQNDLLENV